MALMARVVQALTQGGRRVLCRSCWERRKGPRVCVRSFDRRERSSSSHVECRARGEGPTTTHASDDDDARALPPSLPASLFRRLKTRTRGAADPFLSPWRG